MKEPKYYFDHHLVPPKAFFEWCYYYMPTYEWSNNKETIIASDRKHDFTTKKRLAKNSNLTFFDCKKNFMIILSTSKRIELQTYQVWSSFENGKQILEHALINLEQLSENKHIKVSHEYSTYKFGLAQLNNMFSYYIPDLYPNNWRDRLAKVSELRYLKLWNFYPAHIPTIYKYRKEIEFAQKIKANHLAMDIGEHKESVDMRVVTKNWLKKHKQFLSNSSRGLKDVKLKETIEQRGGKIVPGVEKYLSECDIHLVPEEIGIVKFQNYLIKQQTYFSYYEDYLSMLKDLNVPLSKSTLLPKDIREAHDKAVESLNALKREIVKKGYQERARALAEIEMTIEDYSFLLPKTADELVKEGQTLHHCVGGSNYIDGHAEGRTTIVFIRKNEEPDQPYFTLEFKDKRIVQIRGKHNQSPPEKVEQATEKWFEWVSKGFKKNKLVKAGVA